MLFNKGEMYKIENNRIVVVDPELGLSIDAAFDMRLLPENPLWGQELGCGFFVAGNVPGSEFYVEKNGKPDGQCRLYYPSKALKGEMFYFEGKLHGPSTFYTPQGGVLSVSWFVDGLQQGKCFWYYPEGELYAVQRYKHGIPHGVQEYFHKDGSPKTIVEIEGGSFKLKEVCPNRIPAWRKKRKGAGGEKVL